MLHLAGSEVSGLFFQRPQFGIKVAWRFVDDEALRERLKEAKGIGTPATRAEIIGGLKKQAFLTIHGKHIVPTEAGLSLFGILQQADPALVDPGVTAQLECLLDDVVVGKQEMLGAIDAVCEVAQRIIGKLTETTAAGSPALLGDASATRSFPPTPAMKRYADSLARQLGIKPPSGYKTSMSICGAFLKQHAPKKASGDSNETVEPKPVSSAQLSYARKIAIAKGIVVPDEAKTNSAAMAAWLDSNKGAKHRSGHRKAAARTAGTSTSRSMGSPKRVRKLKSKAVSDAAPTPPHSATATPLRIPYGNKEVALKLGARYRNGGWFAPPGIDLAAFSERGWV